MIRRIILIAALLFTPALSAFAQTVVVDQIQIDGTQRIEPDTVRSYLTIKPGESFQPNEVDKSLKSLYATGLFADVVIGVSGTTLVVKVTENPIINRLAFEGNRKLETDTLTSEVQLRPRVVFTRTKVQADVKRILDLYRRAGRFAATVEPKIIQLPQNRVDLVFEIEEGGLTGISKITFIGNKRFSDGQLRGETQTVESRWYRFLSTDDNYDPDRVTFDRELLRRFYNRNGYADFRVISAIAELAPDRKSFFLTYTLEEGERYKYGKIDIVSSVKDLDPELLKKDLKTEEGDWYNSEQVESSITKMQNRLGTLGYAFVEIEPIVSRDRENHTISVKYEVREGPKVYVERIDISGNVRTLDRVIRREFRLVEGDAFNTEKLKRSERRIKDLGFFKKVEVTNSQGSSPDRTVIQTKVEEQSTGELSLGGGFSSSDGALGQVQIRERNLLGRGQDLSLTTTIAQRRQELDVSYTEPWFLDREVSLTLNAFRITRDLQTSSDYDYRTTGAGFRFGYQVSDNLRQSIGYTLRQDEITNVDADASRFIKDQQGERLNSVISQDLTYNRLDSNLEPSDGYLLSLGNDVAGLGGDAKYLRARLKGQVYFPVAEETVLAMKSEYGYIVGIGDDVRINDRFFLGGDNLRGFKRGGAGPRDVDASDALGANQYYSVQVELNFPLGLPKELGLTGRVFNDVGASWGLDDTGPEVRDAKTLRAAAGFGVSWKSPFGPIRVDLGLPYLKEDFDKSELFRFSFGTKF